MIAITAGAQNFTKELVSDLVQKGQRVRLLLHSKEQHNYFKKSINSNSIEFVVGSILDITCLEELFEGVNVIIHLDEYISFYPADKNEMYQHNVEGTANVVNVALFRKVENIVFLSSVLALGDKSENGVFDESAKWSDVKNAKGYGWSKHLAEREIWRGANEGLNVVILNAGHLVSDNFIHGNFRELISYLLNKNESSDGFFSATHFSDMIKSIVLAIDVQLINEQFIVASQSISFEQLLKEIKSNDSKSFKSINYSTLKQRSNYKSIASLITQRRYTIPTQHHASLLTDKRRFSTKKIEEKLSLEFLDVKATICKLVNNNKTV